MVVTYDFARPGGVKHHAVQLASALRDLGDEVTLVAPSSAATGDAITFDGIVNIPANGSDNQLGVLVSPAKVARYFAEHSFDVVHIHEPLQPALSYWSVWSTRSTPHVATFHAYAEHEPRSLTWARQLSGATIFPWFQRAIAVSPSAARYAAAAWSQPLSVIPNGISLADFAGDAPRAPGPFRLLFVGRVADERKGARYVIDAFRTLRERGVAVELDVVGDVGALTLPDVPGMRVHGTVDRETLIELYRQCDAFVSPATGQESFGIVLLEAMASGKPVICSDIDGYRDVVRGSRVHLVPPRDVEALARAIDGVVATSPELRAHEGAANRLHVERFDWVHVARHVRATYLEAIDELAS